MIQSLLNHAQARVERWIAALSRDGNTSGSSRPLTKRLPVVDFGPMATDDGSSPCSLSAEPEGCGLITQPDTPPQVFDSPNSDGIAGGYRR